MIEAVRSIDAEKRDRALEALCAAYWKPVYKYVRWRWNRPADVDKAGRRQKRGGNVLHVALDFAGAEEELSATVMDPALIPSPESLEEFFRKRMGAKSFRASRGGLARTVRGL